MSHNLENVEFLYKYGIDSLQVMPVLGKLHVPILKELITEEMLRDIFSQDIYVESFIFEEEINFMFYMYPKDLSEEMSETAAIIAEEYLVELNPRIDADYTCVEDIKSYEEIYAETLEIQHDKDKILHSL